MLHREPGGASTSRAPGQLDPDRRRDLRARRTSPSHNRVPPVARSATSSSTSRTDARHCGHGRRQPRNPETGLRRPAKTPYAANPAAATLVREMLFGKLSKVGPADGDRNDLGRFFGMGASWRTTTSRSTRSQPPIGDAIGDKVPIKQGFPPDSPPAGRPAGPRSPPPPPPRLYSVAEMEAWSDELERLLVPKSQSRTAEPTAAPAKPAPSREWLARMATSGCPGLEELDLTATTVSDAVLFAVAAGCPDLRSLNIASDKVPTNHTATGSPKAPSTANTVTNAGLVALAGGCPKLQLLGIAHCRGITGAGLGRIAGKCPDLRHLDLRGLDTLQSMAAAGLEDLVAPAPNLDTVVFGECRPGQPARRVTGANLNKIRRRMLTGRPNRN